jgi:hypothetical protein
MSTSAQVSTAWGSAIFAHASITAFSTQIYNFDIADDKSEAQEVLFRNSQAISFIQYLTVRGEKFGETSETLGRVATYDYQVQISAYRTADINGVNWAAVRDLFDTLFPLVISELGTTWSSTVDYWRPQDGAARIEQILIDDTPVWRGTKSFFATKRVTF